MPSHKSRRHKSIPKAHPEKLHSRPFFIFNKQEGAPIARTHVNQKPSEPFLLLFFCNFTCFFCCVTLFASLALSVQNLTPSSTGQQQDQQ